jgi:restriction system protein
VSVHAGQARVSEHLTVPEDGHGIVVFEFANHKPLELLAGANQLALLAEHANIEPKIVSPDDWHDRVADAPEPR